MKGSISIDDTGTPGIESKSEFLHDNRKSWAAVIVPDDIAPSVDECLDIFTSGIRQDFGAEELHFTDIYSGREAFKDVALKERIKIFEMMGQVFRHFDLPVIYQTMSEEYRSELLQRMGLAKFKAGQWNFDRIEHVGLFALCSRVSGFVEEHKPHFPEPLIGQIDEGLVKAGSCFELAAFGNAFANCRIESVNSSDARRVQLADFAAFCIGRSQWISALMHQNRKLNPGEMQFLAIVQSMNVVNLTSTEVDPATFTVEDYDELLKIDRLAKGLPPIPSKRWS